MFKQLLMLLALSFTFLLSNVVNAAEQQPIQVFIEGEKIDFKEQPIIKNGTTLVPFRPIFEKMGLEIYWDKATQVIVGATSTLEIGLQIGNTKAFINEEETLLTVAPEIIKGTTYIPMRFIGEATGKDVRWDSNKKIIGEGIYYYINLIGAYYSGNFIDGIPTGHGKYYNDKGVLVYDGEWIDFQYNGKGKTYFSDGSIYYNGDFINNKYNGNGKTFFFTGQLRAEGNFSENLLNGQGKTYYSNGQLRAEGNFKNDWLDGIGKFYNEKGTLIYEGEYKDDKWNGKGKQYNLDGTLKFEGIFKDSKPINP